MSTIPSPSRSRSQSSTPPASPLRAPSSRPPLDRAMSLDVLEDRHPAGCSSLVLLACKQDSSQAVRMAVGCYADARAPDFLRMATSSAMQPFVCPLPRTCAAPFPLANASQSAQNGSTACHASAFIYDGPQRTPTVSFERGLNGPFPCGHFASSSPGFSSGQPRPVTL